MVTMYDQMIGELNANRETPSRAKSTQVLCQQLAAGDLRLYRKSPKSWAKFHMITAITQLPQIVGDHYFYNTGNCLNSHVTQRTCTFSFDNFATENKANSAHNFFASL